MDPQRIFPPLPMFTGQKYDKLRTCVGLDEACVRRRTWPPRHTGAEAERED